MINMILIVFYHIFLLLSCLGLYYCLRFVHSIVKALSLLWAKARPPDVAFLSSRNLGFCRLCRMLFPDFLQRQAHEIPFRDAGMGKREVGLVHDDVVVV